MNLQTNTLFIIVILFNDHLTVTGQSVKECDTGSECIFLKSCPNIAKLLESNSPEDLEAGRSSICEIVGRKYKVCCPKTEDLTKTLPQATSQQKAKDSNENLLPNDCGRQTTDDRIIHGTPAPIGSYHWMAALGYIVPGNPKIQFKCAGAIINSKYILTAAHCVHQRAIGSTKLSVIHVGDWDLSKDVDCQESKNQLTNETTTECGKPHLAVGVEETIPHPMYSKRAKSSDDIALIRLNKNLDFKSGIASIGPVCLPPKNIDYKNIATPVAAGWGLTEHGNESSILLRVDIPLADDQLCKEKYKHKFVGNQLCVGGTEEGFDTCSGDSGGPLVATGRFGPPYKQIGIVSFGPRPCGLYKFPGVYTAVADYRDWIISNMKP